MDPSTPDPRAVELAARLHQDLAPIATYLFQGPPQAPRVEQPALPAGQARHQAPGPTRHQAGRAATEAT